MLTVHAIGWNRQKQDGLHLALSSRYVKVLTRCHVTMSCFPTTFTHRTNIVCQLYVILCFLRFSSLFFKILRIWQIYFTVDYPKGSRRVPEAGRFEERAWVSWEHGTSVASGDLLLWSCWNVNTMRARKGGIYLLIKNIIWFLTTISTRFWHSHTHTCPMLPTTMCWNLQCM